MAPFFSYWGRLPTQWLALGLSTLRGWLLSGFSLLVPAHVPIFVHIGLHQVGHLHRVDFTTLAVADLKEEHITLNALSPCHGDQPSHLPGHLQVGPLVLSGYMYPLPLPHTPAIKFNRATEVSLCVLKVSRS